jgi:hypothetical protein
LAIAESSARRSAATDRILGWSLPLQTELTEQLVNQAPLAISPTCAKSDSVRLLIRLYQEVPCSLSPTSISYDRRLQQRSSVIVEEGRSFGDAKYFLVDRGIGGRAIQKEQIVCTRSDAGRPSNRSVVPADWGPLAREISRSLLRTTIVWAHEAGLADERLGIKRRIWVSS